jgi:hypothetical protein
LKLAQCDSTTLVLYSGIKNLKCLILVFIAVCDKPLPIAGTFGRIYHGVLHVANEEDEIEIDTTMDQDIFVKTVTGMLCIYFDFVLFYKLHTQ